MPRRSTTTGQPPASAAQKIMLRATPEVQDLYNRYRENEEQPNFLHPQQVVKRQSRQAGNFKRDGNSRLVVGSSSSSSNSSTDRDSTAPGAQPGAAGRDTKAADPRALKRARGRRLGPIKTKCKTAFLRALGKACEHHKRRKVECTCYDFSELERAYQASRYRDRHGAAAPQQLPSPSSYPVSEPSPPGWTEVQDPTRGGALPATDINNNSVGANFYGGGGGGGGGWTTGGFLNDDDEPFSALSQRKSRRGRRELALKQVNDVHSSMFMPPRSDVYVQAQNMAAGLHFTGTGTGTVELQPPQSAGRQTPQPAGLQPPQSAGAVTFTVGRWVSDGPDDWWRCVGLEDECGFVGSSKDVCWHFIDCHHPFPPNVYNWWSSLDDSLYYHHYQPQALSGAVVPQDSHNMQQERCSEPTPVAAGDEGHHATATTAGPSPMTASTCAGLNHDTGSESNFSLSSDCATSVDFTSPSTCSYGGSSYGSPHL